MHADAFFERGHSKASLFFFMMSFAVFAAAVIIAHQVQTDFGRLQVANTYYKNYNGKHLRAKLFKPLEADEQNPLPGVVFIHGYQNNRESGDAYCIELARRGFVVLGIDALGRGNSDIPNALDDPDFDDTFGTRSSVGFLRSLPFVRQASVGVMGHSMGAKFAYQVALEDAAIRAVIIVGSAYDEQASFSRPANMLMIIGELDEFRDFFTKTKDIIKEWMQTPATRNAFPHPKPEFGPLYGDFETGTARKVFLQRISHIQESHNRACIAEAVQWMRQALDPPETLWSDPHRQTWPLKEAMTLLAMLACFACTLPLSLGLLRTEFFAPVRGPVQSGYACEARSYLKGALVNGLLMWLYLPLIMTLFAVHKFLVPVDPIFPMLLVDAIVWWFVWINLIGLFLFRSWFRKEAAPAGTTLYDLGISYRPEGFFIDRHAFMKTVFLGLILFGFLYGCEWLSETYFLVDFRFIYPLVSDLTWYRVGMFGLYFPFVFLGFLGLTVFIHGRMRRPRKETWLRTYLSWTGANILVLITPLALFLLVQYVPLLSTGYIPFEGPGGVFVVFILELFFIMLTLAIVMVLSTWFYLITGRIYLSALMNALIVTWLFASSQVIAPIP